MRNDDDRPSDLRTLPPTESTSMTLAPDVSQVAAARRFVHAEVERRNALRPDDAELLASEAVGNAVRHAATDEITVTVAAVDRVVRVFVHDDDPAHPVLSERGPTTVGGHGMHLINTLAADWGVTPVEGDGKELWFDLERGAAPTTSS